MQPMTEDLDSQAPTPNRWRRRIAIATVVLLLYVLSIGPVLGMAFWLREATGWDGFYAVMWLYLPLLYFHPVPILDGYLEWWVSDVFHTVGPG